MKSAIERNPAQIVRSRGIGAVIGAVIGAGWMAYGLFWFPVLIRILFGLMGLAAVIPLLVGARRMIAAARSQPAPDAAAQAASRRVWKLFWINFAVEMVLLNLVVNLLRQPDQRVYWIPAISLVVGLHFLPMASFFRVPSYWSCGVAMMGMAVAATLAIRSGVAAAQPLVAGEALVNALILWSTGAWGLRSAARLASISFITPLMPDQSASEIELLRATDTAAEHPKPAGDR